LSRYLEDPGTHVLPSRHGRRLDRRFRAFRSAPRRQVYRRPSFRLPAWPSRAPPRAASRPLLYPFPV